MQRGFNNISFIIFYFTPIQFQTNRDKLFRKINNTFIYNFLCYPE